MIYSNYDPKRRIFKGLNKFDDDPVALFKFGVKFIIFLVLYILLLYVILT